MTSHADDLADATLSALLLANTQAGTAIEIERVDEVAAGDMPRIVIFYAEDMAGESPAGTAPRFKVTATLIVQCLVENARLRDVRNSLRVLMSQARAALLNNADWVKMTEAVHSLKIGRTYKSDAARIVGDGRLEFSLSWSETYPPDETTPLTSIYLTENIGPDGTPQPLAVINIPTP